MEMYNFIRQETKPHHLTIADIIKLNPGDKLDVVIWDRNFEESWIWNNAESEKPYDPQEFFEQNHHQLTYLGDMKWAIHFNWGSVKSNILPTDQIKDLGETIERPIHLDTISLQTNWTWVPLDENDGCIHITNEFIKTGEQIPDHWKPKHLHWTEFPDSTRVGYRGQIMLWDKLKDMSPVYYKEGYYGDNLIC